MAAVPETWSERAKVSICVEGDSDVQFEADTETVDVDVGDKDIEAIATLSGGRLVKYIPQEMTTITLETYPIQAGTDSGTTGKGFFDLMHSQDASQPVSVSVDHTRNRYRLVALWTNDTTNTAAHSAVASGSYALRVIGCGFFTSVKGPNYTDGVVKFTVQMKCPPFKKDGSANVNIGSCDTSATMSAVTTFSATQQGF